MRFFKIINLLWICKTTVTLASMDGRNFAAEISKKGAATGEDRPTGRRPFKKQPSL